MLSESPKAVSRGTATRLRTPCLDILPVPENHGKMPNFVDLQKVMPCSALPALPCVPCVPCPALPLQPDPFAPRRSRLGRLLEDVVHLARRVSVLRSRGWLEWFRAAASSDEVYINSKTTVRRELETRQETGLRACVNM